MFHELNVYNLRWTELFGFGSVGVHFESYVLPGLSKIGLCEDDIENSYGEKQLYGLQLYGSFLL